jgi:membrane protein DedA with SNARE-associated domain
MAGLMVKLGDMNLYTAIFIGGLGGFAGDQIYFFIGRNNKEYVRTKFKNHNKKLNLAHQLLEKYGWPVIFLQRYLYGLRTVIPISIGLTHYSAKKYAFINFISGIVWAAITITLSYIYGDELLVLLDFLKKSFYIFIPFILLFILLFFRKKKS